MIQAKAIQIRDEATHIPALAWRFDSDIKGHERSIMRRAGFDSPAGYVILTRLSPVESQYDPYQWSGGSRTMQIAHLLLQGDLHEATCGKLGIVPDTIELYTFERLDSGDVLDVGHALGFNERKSFE